MLPVVGVIEDDCQQAGNDDSAGGESYLAVCHPVHVV